MWLRFARCVARSVIVVAGKFASILICGLAAELRNSQPQSVLRFCVFGGQGFFWVDFSWSAFRNSQPQSVLRFRVFGGQGFFGLTKKAKNRVGCRCGLYVDLTWLVVCTSLLCPSDKIGPDVTVDDAKSVIRLTSTFCFFFPSSN